MVSQFRLALLKNTLILYIRLTFLSAENFSFTYHSFNTLSDTSILANNN
jgi:hypothetical protein